MLYDNRSNLKNKKHFKICDDYTERKRMNGFVKLKESEPS